MRIWLCTQYTWYTVALVIYTLHNVTLHNVTKLNKKKLKKLRSKPANVSINDVLTSPVMTSLTRLLAIFERSILSIFSLPTAIYNKPIFPLYMYCILCQRRNDEAVSIANGLWTLRKIVSRVSIYMQCILSQI